MRRFALCFCVCAASAQAQTWQPMTGAEINAALTNKVVRYNMDTIQDFRSSGRTLYTHKGRDSWGYWRVRGDQYCSQWPPSGDWACYDMDRDGDQVRFIGAGNDITVGRYVE